MDGFGKRCAYAAVAMGEATPPACPFRPMACNKCGGVCSIQPYREAEQRISGTAGEPMIVCPTRFEQDGVIHPVTGLILRRWHSKIAVAVDRPFFASFGEPSAQPSRIRMPVTWCGWFPSYGTDSLSAVIGKC